MISLEETEEREYAIDKNTQENTQNSQDETQKRKDEQTLLQQEEKGREICGILWEMESRNDGETEIMQVYVCGLSNFIDSGLKGKVRLRNSCWRC